MFYLFSLGLSGNTTSNFLVTTQSINFYNPSINVSLTETRNFTYTSHQVYNHEGKIAGIKRKIMRQNQWQTSAVGLPLNLHLKIVL